MNRAGGHSGPVRLQGRVIVRAFPKTPFRFSLNTAGEWGRSVKRHSGSAGAVCLGLFLAFAPAQAQQAPPPPEAFGRLPALDEPSLSPDGKHFAAVETYRGRPVAVIGAVGAPAGTHPAIIGSSDWIVDHIQWAKNDRLLLKIKKNQSVSWAKDAHLVHSWGRTLSVSLDGKDVILLFEHNSSLNLNIDATEVDDLDTSDPDNIYMPLSLYADFRSPEEQARGDDNDAFYLALYRVNVHTGDTEKVLSGSHATENFYMDGNGHVVARIDETTRPLVEHLLFFDKGDWREFDHYDATGDHGSGIVGLTEDGKALVQHAHGDDGLSVFGRIELDGGKESFLYSNPRFDAETPLYDEWNGRVVGISYTDDTPKFHFFDDKREALQRGLEKAFPGLTVSAVSSDMAQQHLIVKVEGPRQPPDYYFLDRATHHADELAASYPELTEADLGEMKPYPYKARDGLDIPAYITLPPGRIAKNLPAVVLPHGGPDYRDAIGFDWWAQFMANRGYVVLQPNYRGSSGYGRKFTEAGLHQWGLKMQDDITDGVKKMIADGVADPKRICIVGASYGGYAALAGATLTPDLYACAVSFAGVSDLPRILSFDRRRAGGKDSSGYSFWISRIGSPYDDSDVLRATSPARHADQVKCPVLLMHGETDATVPIEQSELMESALKDAGKNVRFVRFPGEDHYFTFADTRIRMLKELESFLAANIGVGAQK